MKVLIADSHWLARKALKTLLATAIARAEVLEAETLGEALDLLGRHEDLDLLILDDSLLRGPMLETCREVRAQAPDLPVILLLESRDGGLAEPAATWEGAHCLDKTSSGPAIMAAVGQVVTGEPSSSARPPGDDEDLDSLAAAFVEAGAEEIANLTPRQREILALLGEGATNAEIAVRLDLSVNTVRVHVHALLKRLGLRNRTQAVLLAAGHRLPGVSPGPRAGR